MKKVFVGILCLSSTVALAQDKKTKFSTQKPEPAAVITGWLEQAPNDSIVALYEPYSGDTASAIIKDHKFQLRMPMSKGGSMYILQIGNNIEKTGMVLYLEDGKMDIKGKGDNFKTAKFSGAKYVKEWQEVGAITDPFSGDGKKLADLEKRYHDAVAVGDEDVSSALKEQANVVDARMKDTLKRWITAHPNSGVCGYILTAYFLNDKKFIDSVYDKLGEHAQMQRVMQRYKKPGLIDPSPISVKMGDDVAPETLGKVKKGAPAPDFEIKDLAGNTVKLSDFKGKYVFIDFWASWCAPCIAQVPHMKEVNEKFKNKNFLFMGVSLDTKHEGWEKSVKKNELNWLNVSNLKGWAEPVATLYGVRAIPSNVLIDPDGNVVANDLAGDALIKKLEELLK
ncbi:TlpA disulfide reductase family protein [uncultured Chitinophaga sp.]|uniref:TlpA disulfide reductase family protein n=1 Tax=uncultured Chitinophaga sp. TaxID=339340 RepID=UPI0025DC3FE3|nr:TlpA disulfide reductase family protein [uncultured Chitinophaga sp.]